MLPKMSYQNFLLRLRPDWAMILRLLRLLLQNLGEELPFSFYTSSVLNPIAEIQGRLAPLMVVRLRLA